MPEGQCPHCEATLELPANKADVFTCLSCGQQFGWLPDEGEGMEAEIVMIPQRTSSSFSEKSQERMEKIAQIAASMLTVGLATVSLGAVVYAVVVTCYILFTVILIGLAFAQL